MGSLGELEKIAVCKIQHFFWKKGRAVRHSVARMSLAVALGAGVARATDSSVPFIRADQVHAMGITGAGVTVAVIDTGIYYDHPGLLGSISDGGISFENGRPVFDGGADIYEYGHGTYMSLIITDGSGVAPDAKTLPIRVLGGSRREDRGSGETRRRINRVAQPPSAVILCQTLPGRPDRYIIISWAAGASRPLAGAVVRFGRGVRWA
jgi:subtilisin family serine protease